MDRRRFSRWPMAAILMVLLFALASCAKRDGQWESYGVIKPGGVEGVLTDEDGRPLEGAEVYFYTDPARKFRGPAEFMAEPTGPDGRYVTELPPGSYWAVARKRASGSISGNLQKGDLYTREAAGPLEIVDGRYERVDLTLVELTGNMLFSVFAGGGGGQAVKGVIRDRDGTPRAHAYAFAYRDGKMVGKPDHVSEWTREDGVYTLHLPEPGVYYIGARTGFMGVPRPDEPYGRYAGTKDHSVAVVEGGVVEGVDVTLGRFSGSR